MKQDVLTGRLGTSFTTDDLPRDCHSDSENSANETACLEWQHIAKMKVTRLSESATTKCYHVHWQSLQEGLNLQDCFSYSESYWYGMGEFNPQLWPMNHLKTAYVNFVTGNISQDVFGHILEGYWVTSKGVAIIADLSIPLSVIFCHDSGDALSQHVCIMSKSSQHLPMPVLKYTLCTSWDAREVHRHVLEEIKPKARLPPSGLFAIENLVWSTRQKYGSAVNDSLLLHATDELLHLDSDITATILINSQWQLINGDFAFDHRRFPNINNTLFQLKTRGFKVALSIHPYINTSSENYYKYLPKSFWVRDIIGDRPNLIHWDDMPSAVLLDFTNSEASDWFINKLEELRKHYQINSFQFLGGETTSLPPYATFHQPLQSLNDYSRRFNEMVTKSNLGFSVAVTSQFPVLSTFVSLSPRWSTWSFDRGLRSIIPAVFSSSIVGSPFVLIGPVGGEISVDAKRPDRHLYIRWFQLSCFFPVLELSILPSDYDNETVDIAKKFMQLRRDLVMSKLKVAIDEAETFGYPIIRPLWWVAPNDTDAQNTNSEFLVGNDLLVAPIMGLHEDQRDIYLPPGLWADRDNAPHKGGKWLYDHRSSLSQIAYFVRVKDDQMYA